MPDNGVGRGARRPVDVCSARTEAERRSNPQIKNFSNRDVFFNARHRRVRAPKNNYLYSWKYKDD